ncbi:hypothetical protein ACFRAE_05625 [Sphingobacterium sp. HJSM2_6]|uniref:hypothetical protein n=1 Tax=Sphingobacterium sp. HJSM2_6 TaxID=3366264 RepID=UPI003BE874E5
MKQINLRHKVESLLRILVKGTYENLKYRRNHILKTYREKPVEKNLYVSFTTYGPRVHIFEYTVLSILAGSILPEKILIYVPKGFKDLLYAKTDSILLDHLELGIIELIEMEEDLGCHSKYFYAFKAYGDQKDIVICDDDVVYYVDWLKDLIQGKHNHPDFDVFAYKAVQVYRTDDAIEPYDNWFHLTRNQQEGKTLYAEGVGGVLFLKNKLTKEVFNKEVFMKITPKADDVWLWFCTYYNKLNVKYISPKNNTKLLYVIPDSQVVNLWSDNTSLKRNDIYVANCNTYFKEQLNFELMPLIPLAPESHNMNKE